MAKRKPAAARRAAARKRAAAQAQAMRKEQFQSEPTAASIKRAEREAARDAQEEVFRKRKRLLNTLEVVTIIGALYAGAFWVIENFGKSAYKAHPDLRPTLAYTLLAVVVVAVALGLYVTIRDRAWLWAVLAVVPFTCIPASFYYALTRKRELLFFAGGNAGRGNGSRSRGSGSGRNGGGTRGSGGGRGSGGSGGRSSGKSGKDKEPPTPPDKIKLLGDR